MVWIEKSITRVTDRLAEWCRTVILSDRFFYPHHTPMIDTLSCIPFDLPHLIFKKICYKATVFPLKNFCSYLMKLTLPATAVRDFTLTSNLHKVTSFSDIMAVKTNGT